MSAGGVAGDGLVLTLNAGSSSIKFAVYAWADCLPGQPHPQPAWRGQIDGLTGHPRFIVKDAAGHAVAQQAWDETLSHAAAMEHLLGWLDQTLAGHPLRVCGHRVVHGGVQHALPAVVDEALLDDLQALCPLAPLHQPHNLAPIRLLRATRPSLPQVACFDTAFHRGQDEVVQRFALPRWITERGVRRYGFHGLSYEHIAGELPRVAPGLAQGRVIVAHLGNGASLCAMRGGRSLASTMGFSALDGLMMGTRCGTLDAAVVFYLLRELKMSPAEAEKLLYNDSGLKGVSGVSNDMRALRERADEPPVREALDLYVHRIAREVGSLCAVLGGLDGLVFTAGIGEHDAATRAEVIRACAWLGLELDEAANAAGGPLISRPSPTGTGPQAWVIPTDEEAMIARHAVAALGAAGSGA